MSKRVSREILKLRPDLRATDGHFYVTPVGHILCGFVYEQASAGAYIWRFAFPLYDRVEFISLAFGERLPHTEGFLPRANRTDQELATEFIRRIKPYEAGTFALQDLATFLAYIESLETLNNPWVRRAYAMSLIMLGRADEAETQLKLVSTSPTIGDYPRFREDIAKVAADLSRGVEFAHRTLLAWEAESKLRLGLSD